MIVHVKGKELLMQAKKVARAVPCGTLTKEFTGILLEADDKSNLIKMTSTNFEIAIRSALPASVEKGGSVIVDTKLLIGILSLIAGDDVYMELLANGRFYINSGKTRYELAALPGKQYPKVDIPFPGDTISVKGLKNLIRQSIFAVNKSGAHNSIYNCVNIVISNSGAWAIATDCIGCVVQVKGDSDCKGNMSILIPHTSLSSLASMSDDEDVYELGVTGNNGIIKNAVFSDGMILFSVRLMEGSFFDTNKMFNSAVPKIKGYVAAEEIYQALDCIVPFSTNQDRVEISFGNGELFLCCKNNDINFNCGIKADGMTESTDKFYYSIKKLTQCFRNLTGKALLSFSEEGNLIIQNDTVRSFITRAMEPKAEELKLKTKKAKPEKKSQKQVTAA